ncbi:hypothetical protein [Actinoplanes awajinensis]|nr:hypothetical protein [Actinoplanes awajinensis]
MTGDPEHEGGSSVIMVGLIATPPDHPAWVAQRLADELAELLASAS